MAQGVIRMSTRFCLLALVSVGRSLYGAGNADPDALRASELSLRIAIQVNPDAILQDGGLAGNAAARGLGSGTAGRRATWRSEIATQFDGIIQDFGTLSAKTVVTGDDGRARATYTAPPRPAEPVDEFNVVTFAVTPIGTDFAGEGPRTAQLRLLPPGIVRPPNQTPEPAFTFAPSNPAILTNVIFDASTTRDEGAPCGVNCTYSWEFGDGEKGLGIFASHVYRTTGIFQVRLTVRDAQGGSALVAQPITVGGGQAPTAVIHVLAVLASHHRGDLLHRGRLARRHRPNHRVLRLELRLGPDGHRRNDQQELRRAGRLHGDAHSDRRRGTADDDAANCDGERRAMRTASFTFSPSAPAVDETISFTAEASRAAVGRRLVSYEWNFGSGRVGAGVLTTQSLRDGRHLTVTLTVTDDLGNKGTTSQAVSISLIGSLQAVLRVSPTAGGAPGTIFQFDGAESTRGASPIVDTRFNFGDNTDDVVGPSPVATHAFAAPGSYQVSLLVRDSAGRTSVARVTVVVGRRELAAAAAPGANHRGAANRSRQRH